MEWVILCVTVVNSAAIGLLLHRLWWVGAVRVRPAERPLSHRVGEP